MLDTLSIRRLLPLAVITGLGLALMSSPAEAHGIGNGGISAGFLHPIAGIDHLLLLVSVGAAAAAISSQLLLWGLAGGLIGGLFGGFGGSLPAAELLASLAISVVAVLVLRSLRSGPSPAIGAAGGLISGSVAIHAMLHGSEAPADHTALVWWLGALLGSALISGSTYLVLSRLPLQWTARLSLLLALFGGLLLLGPIGLLAS